jgi:hypothetical protein
MSNWSVSGSHHHRLTACMGCLLSLLQMLSALSAAGLGAQEVEHLWACYEKAKAAEEKAGFATGQQQQSVPGYGVAGFLLMLLQHAQHSTLSAKLQSRGGRC